MTIRDLRKGKKPCPQQPAQHPPTAKSKDRNASQSHSSGKQLRDTTLRNSRCKKSHIWPHRKKPWLRVGTVDCLKASR